MLKKLALLRLAVAMAAVAQTSTRTMVGVVYDSSGAVIPCSASA